MRPAGDFGPDPMNIRGMAGRLYRELESHPSTGRFCVSFLAEAAWFELEEDAVWARFSMDWMFL
jgi:hypothetical protein